MRLCVKKMLKKKLQNRPLPKSGTQSRRRSFHMNASETKTPFVAIALRRYGVDISFRGLRWPWNCKSAVAKSACSSRLKEIDQQESVKVARDMEIFTLPPSACKNRNYLSFAFSFWKSFRAAIAVFKRRPPQAVLAMGGFTSAPPILAARKFGAKTFLHESNTIPGRANRFLGRYVDEGFVGFPETADRIRASKKSVTGNTCSPAIFQEPSPSQVAACRSALGLAPDLPTVLVVGGSQGASGLNELILSALPLLASKKWQWLHLTGANDFEKVKAAYRTQN